MNKKSMGCFRVWGLMLAPMICLLGLTLVLHLNAIAAPNDQNAEAQIPSYQCSIKVPEPEPKDLSSLAKIKADQAMAVAQAAITGTTVKKVELENENGCLVYSVSLNNGMEVKVDAGNGKILQKEAESDDEHEGHEKDD